MDEKRWAGGHDGGAGGLSSAHAGGPCARTCAPPEGGRELFPSCVCSRSAAAASRVAGPPSVPGVFQTEEQRMGGEARNLQARNRAQHHATFCRKAHRLLKVAREWSARLERVLKQAAAAAVSNGRRWTDGPQACMYKESYGRGPHRRNLNFRAQTNAGKGILGCHGSLHSADEGSRLAVSMWPRMIAACLHARAPHAGAAATRFVSLCVCAKSRHLLTCEEI